MALGQPFAQCSLTKCCDESAVPQCLWIVILRDPNYARPSVSGKVTVSGIGIVIGAGIYVLIGAAPASVVAAVWMAFVMAAILAALTELSYAELASMFPSAGAEYAFARSAFNEMSGFLVGWLMVSRPPLTRRYLS